MSVWLKRYVETHLGEPVWGAYALSAFWLGNTVSRMIISPIIKIPSLRKIFFGNFISAVVLIAGLSSGSARGIAAASLAAGLSSGYTLPLIIAQFFEWHPKKETAFGITMFYMAIFIGFALFPPFSGKISDLFGIPWGVALGAIGSLLAAVFSGLLNAHLSGNNNKL